MKKMKPKPSTEVSVVVSRQDLEELKKDRFAAALFKIGDEVAVHADGGLKTIGEWTLPYESKLGIISRVLVNDSMVIAYEIDEVNKFSLKKTGLKVGIDEFPIVLETFVQLCPFIQVRLHNFQSDMASEFSRPKDKGWYGGKKTIEERDLIRMQMAFYEYGKKGIFPPEWERMNTRRFFGC